MDYAGGFMNRLFFSSFLFAIAWASMANADESSVIKGSMEQVVCISKGALKVRGDDLNSVIFEANAYEPVKPFQGWGENKKTKVIQGVKYSYIKVQFTQREAEGRESIGWVAEAFIKLRSACPGASKPAVPDSPNNGSGSSKGLDDPSCCVFPLSTKTTNDYRSGMARFGAGRSGGARLHAACDLYRYTNDPILSVANGKVIRDKYYFYQGTYALEVKHQGGFVVRYGEITGKNAPNTSSGSSVRAGATVGFMGKVNSNCCEPILHFELYSGKKSGALRALFLSSG